MALQLQTRIQRPTPDCLQIRPRATGMTEQFQRLRLADRNRNRKRFTDFSCRIQHAQLVAHLTGSPGDIGKQGVSIAFRNGAIHQDSGRIA